MTHPGMCIAMAAALTLSACSSRPREFTALPKVPPADLAAYQQVHESCRVQVAQGRRSGFVGSAAGGTAAAVGTGAAMIGSAGPGMFAGAAAASMAAVVMPIVGIGAAWGIAKAKKAKKERDVRQAMALCLTENGHEVGDWKKATSTERRTRRAADRNRRLALKAKPSLVATKASTPTDSATQSVPDAGVPPQ